MFILGTVLSLAPILFRQLFPSPDKWMSIVCSESCIRVHMNEACPSTPKRTNPSIVHACGILPWGPHRP